METAALLRALQEIEKRAERMFDEQAVMKTYVEAGALVPALMSTDNGTIAGRRGTGKTHALRYLAERQRQNGNLVVYIDVVKDLGSTEGLYGDPAIPVGERASRLLIDVLNIVHSRLLEDAFELGDSELIATLEQVFDHMGEVVVATSVEEETARQQSAEAKSTSELAAKVTAHPSLTASVGTSSGTSASEALTIRRSGVAKHRVHFGAVADLIQRALDQHPAKRCWLLLDEWSSLSPDLQPYLAEMLRRLFFALPKVTVRMAIIPHRTHLRLMKEDGTGYVGLELGSELFPLLDLDEFVVFPARSREEQAQRASEFFKSLLFLHINSVLSEAEYEIPGSQEQMVSLLFTQVTSLQELIRAAEGVPRDALMIVARAALRAGDGKISTDHIRDAAAQVYQSTKAALLNGVPSARRLLEAIVSEVISEKRARAFLLAPDHTESDLITHLVDDRILHIIKRGYSSKGDPGTRFDVLQIDYGCYVQLLRTNSAPIGLFGPDGPAEDTSLQALFGDISVPEDDYRAIRRAVLDLPSVLARIANT